MYVVYAMAGFPGIVLGRAVMLAGLCGLAGFLAARLSASFYAGIAAACATASVVIAFTADRPGVVSFLGVAVFVSLLELRRGWWALPPLALLWANCHGGFFLGWLVLFAYLAETLLIRPRPTWLRDSRRLWLVTACALAASGINPNGSRSGVHGSAYRRSPMTANLIEWQAPKLWGPPYGFDLLLYAAALVLILSWRRVRPAHWILFCGFRGGIPDGLPQHPAHRVSGACLDCRLFSVSRTSAGRDGLGPPILAASGAVAVFAQGRLPQLRAAAWTVPRARRTTCSNTM